MTALKTTSLDRKRYLLDVEKLALEQLKLHQLFLVEEYKEKWKYIQHQESERDRQWGWFVAISGALFGWLLKDIKSFEKSLQEVDFQLALVFVAVYAALVCLIFIYQKVSYSNYVARLRAIEEKLAKGQTTAGHRTPIFSVFHCFLAAPVLFGGGSTALLAYGLLGSSHYVHDPCIIPSVVFFVYIGLFMVVIPRRVRNFSKETLQNPVPPELVEGLPLTNQGLRQAQSARDGVLQTFPNQGANHW